MDFYERIADAFTRRKVNRAQVGRETGVSGQAVTHKLKRKSAVTQHEIEVYARHAGMSVSEALGEGSVVLNQKDEQEWVEVYRRLTPEQRERHLLEMWRELARQQTEGGRPHENGPA